MAGEKKLRRKLRDAQEKHNKILKRIEKGRTKLDAREHELRVLEAKLAELERTIHAPADESGDVSANKPAPLRPARLLVNPNSATIASGTHTLPDIVNCLRRHGIEAQVTIKTSGKVVREVACDAVKQNEELVIVAGGDGTIEKVAAQLVGSETKLGILPLGTMNNLARALGVPLDLEDACALLEMGTDRKIDVGRVDVKAKRHIKFFLETAGLGLSAIAFPMGQEVKKGFLSAIPDALRKIVEFKASPVRVELDDGQVIQANSHVITVSNSPLTGMNFLIAPEAKMDDGWLDVAIYDEMSKTDLLGYLLGARNGHRADHPKIKRYKSRHVHIMPEDPEPVVSDKDALPELEDLEIEILSQALRVIVGKGIGLTFPVDVAPSVPPLAGPQVTNGHTGNNGAAPADKQNTATLPPDGASKETVPAAVVEDRSKDNPAPAK